MRKTILAAMSASLIVASTAHMAVAAERHHVRKMDRAATTSDQFRNANNSVARPAQPAWPAQSDWSSGYAQGHILSAPSSAQ
jgi:hypothetical protein